MLYLLGYENLPPPPTKKKDVMQVNVLIKKGGSRFKESYEHLKGGWRVMNILWHEHVRMVEGAFPLEWY